MDRASKLLLIVIALGIWANAVWKVSPFPAARGQSLGSGGGMPGPEFAVTPAYPPTMTISPQGVAYVISGNAISAYSVEKSKGVDSLKLIGSEPLPGGRNSETSTFYPHATAAIIR